MARIITQAKDFEIWKSAVRGKTFIKRFDRKGDLIDEMVGPGRTVHLLPEERRLNQEMSASPELDMFQNGTFTPVKLVETSDEEGLLVNNPNHVSEDDMRKLVGDKRALKKLSEAVQGVTNSVTLQRFLEIAKDEDASLKQVGLIEQRISELSGVGLVNEHETVAAPDGRMIVQTKAPPSPAPRNPAQGRY